MSAIVVNHLEERFPCRDGVGIAVLYCSYSTQEEQTTEKLLAGLHRLLAYSWWRKKILLQPPARVVSVADSCRLLDLFLHASRPRLRLQSAPPTRGQSVDKVLKHTTPQSASISKCCKPRTSRAAARAHKREISLQQQTSCCSRQPKLHHVIIIFLLLLPPGLFIASSDGTRHPPRYSFARHGAFSFCFVCGCRLSLSSATSQPVLATAAAAAAAIRSMILGCFDDNARTSYTASSWPFHLI